MDPSPFCLYGPEKEYFRSVPDSGRCPSVQPLFSARSGPLSCLSVFPFFATQLPLSRLSVFLFCRAAPSFCCRFAFSFPLLPPALQPFLSAPLPIFAFRSFLSVSSLFSCPSRLSFLPCFLPAPPFSLPPFPPFLSLFPACSASVSCSPALFPVLPPLFPVRPALVSCSPASVSCSPASVSRPPGPCFPSASPHSSASPFSPPFRPVLSPLSLFPDRFAPISSPGRRRTPRAADDW